MTIRPDSIVSTVTVDRISQEQGFVAIHLVNSDVRLTVRTDDRELVNFLSRFGGSVTVTWATP